MKDLKCVKELLLGEISGRIQRNILGNGRRLNDISFRKNICRI